MVIDNSILSGRSKLQEAYEEKAGENYTCKLS